MGRWQGANLDRTCILDREDETRFPSVFFLHQGCLRSPALLAGSPQAWFGWPRCRGALDPLARPGTMDDVLTLLTLLPLCFAQDVPDRKEQERLVRAYIALDTSDPEQLVEGRGLLEALAGVPFPEGRDVKRWNKVLAAALEERLEARPLARKAGEHADPLDGRTGRYFLGGQLKRPKGLFVGLHGGGKGSGDAALSTGVWSAALEGRDEGAPFASTGTHVTIQVPRSRPTAYTVGAVECQPYTTLTFVTYYRRL